MRTKKQDELINNYLSLLTDDAGALYSDIINISLKSATIRRKRSRVYRSSMIYITSKWLKWA
jgi:hypothetical protein